MFALYEDNRRSGIPNYITEDFLVLSYSMLLEQAIGRVEETLLVPAFQDLVHRLRAALAELPEDEIRRANQQYLAVLSCLLDSDERPAAAADPVAEEVQRVFAAQGEAFSPLMAQYLDYSQMRVRGRYDRQPQMRRYFRAVRWAGSVLFAVLPSEATGITPEAADRLTDQALQLTRLITEQEAIREAWEILEQHTGWWFGPADDLTVPDFQEVASRHRQTPRRQEKTAVLRRRLLEHARQQGRQPRILGAALRLDRLEDGLQPRDVLTGWRFLPQRSTAESAALQQLVHDRVGTYLGSAQPKTLGFAGGRPVKSFPSGLELMALLGSGHAARALDTTDERNFEGYDEAAERARAELAAAGGIGGRHLALLRFWLREAGAAGQPGSGRRTNTALALWTYQRYLGLLYGKQTYTGVSKGFSLPPERRIAWLEPAVELYAWLHRAARELAARAGSGPYTAYLHLLERCIRIAVDERAGLDLDDAAVDFLNDLDVELFKLVGRHDTPIVVDVHTDPASQQVLQQGLGWPRAITKDLAGDRIARGALFRHYEFKQPLSDRLTDAAWRRLLAVGEVPGPATGSEAETRHD